jgi:hypothetical protein
MQGMDLLPVVRTDSPFPVFEYIPLAESPKRARLGNAKLTVPGELDDMVRTAAQETGDVPWGQQFLI